MSNMPFDVTPEDVAQALRAVDAFARLYMSKK